MTRHRGIVAAGNWIVDRVKVIDAYPPEEHLATIDSESRSNGGAPFNVLVDLARLGVDIPLAGIGLVGNDPDGEWIRATCVAHNIDTTQLRTTPDAPTAYTDVMTVRQTGRRTFFHRRGANALFAPAHLDFSTGLVAHARILHLGYLLLLDILDRPDGEHATGAATVLRRAREAGMLTSVDIVTRSDDSGGCAATVLSALRYADYAFLNEIEAGQCAGEAIRTTTGELDYAALARAATRLVSAGVHRWVIVHYPEGAYACAPDGTVVTRGSVQLPAARVTGASGAGDAFAAGVLSVVHEGADMADALQVGVCAAAASLTHATSSLGVGSLPDCLALGTAYGYHVPDVSTRASS